MFGGGGQIFALIVVAISFVALISVIKYKTGEINYRNADATWHTLLTIEAYNQTSPIDHLFLPITSLGGESDKGIPWGATIPDNKGNYYYTSFSPAGYFLPWVFFRIFNLSVTESSLYIFNSILFGVSAILWVWLIYIIYQDSNNKVVVSIIGLLTYVLSPELLHGMGMVYWHQSVMQVSLLIQIIAYYKMNSSDKNSDKIIFYAMALVNPYIEWTGYIANVGFALAELISYWKNSKKEAFKKVFILGIITIMSFVIFTMHYLMRVEAVTFFDALRKRFMARNVTTSTLLTDVFGSYLSSFLYLWILFLCLIVWNFIKNKKIEMRHGVLCLIMVFPIVENILMKQHALSYTYDRMKFIFILSFLICELASDLLDTYKKRVLIYGVLIGITTTAGIANLISYLNNSTYIWETDYRENNKVLAQYVSENYSDAILCSGTYIRGYMNLLFGKGIYEFATIDDIKSIAQKNDKQYIVSINTSNANGVGVTGVFKLAGINVYDVISGENTEIYLNGNEIVCTEKSLGYKLADLTDRNWTRGYSNTSDILLFKRDDSLLIELLSNERIICENEIYHMESIDYDNKWIRVLVDREAKNCMYPADIFIE